MIYKEAKLLLATAVPIVQKTFVLNCNECYFCIHVSYLFLIFMQSIFYKLSGFFMTINIIYVYLYTRDLLFTGMRLSPRYSVLEKGFNSKYLSQYQDFDYYLLPG